LPLSPRVRWKLDRFREQFSSLFGSRKENSRPRLCPACGTLVGATATRCHQCGASMTFSLAAISRSFGRFLPATSPATYAILTLSCILYGATLIFTIRQNMGQSGGGSLSSLWNLGGIGSQILYLFGASLPWPGDFLEPWRLVMAVFLHGSLLHIGFNMWVLMDIGPQIEELYGSARFLFIYVATGTGGYIFSSTVGHHMSIGGSGALLGLIGVLLAITTNRRSAGMQMLRSHLIRWLIYIAVWGFLFPGIDNYAHFGGLVSGFLLGKLMADRQPQTPTEVKRAQLLGWATCLAVAASIVIVARGFIHLS
jgi:rhomboid protease GluP